MKLCTGRYFLSSARHVKSFGRLAGIILLMYLPGGISCQEQVNFSDFGFHSGFFFAGERIDKCKTYHDTVSHLLFNPCFDFRNRGIYSSYLARKIILGDCLSCDSVLVVLPREMTRLDWDYVKKQQQEAWDYYLRLWQKQDRLEKYYIDLEGTIRNFKPLSF